MLKTNFYIKADKAKENGECPIYAKVTFNNKSVCINSEKVDTIPIWLLSENGLLILGYKKIDK